MQHPDIVAGRVVPAVPERLMLRSADNGGWIVEEAGDFARSGRIVGAYTNTQDMLDALAELLIGATPEVIRIRAEQAGEVK